MEMDEASHFPLDRVAEDGHFKEMAFMGDVL